jgi:hypothetical protein
MHENVVSRQRDRTLDEYKAQLFKAQEGIAHLKEGNSLKTKEVLSLERGIERNKKRADHFASENDVLALENRRMQIRIEQERHSTRNPDHVPVRAPV